MSSAHLASPSTNSVNAASILACVDFLPVPNSTMLPVLTSIISISVRTTCVRDFGCWILARAGSAASPIPNRSAPGSNPQSKLQFAQPLTFQTSGHAVHPVR
ncbi:MAG: hypothetical protein QOK09_309 [Mycobacterium sp.]|nr:hypothetical protein [Mycobacterium sp.]